MPVMGVDYENCRLDVIKETKKFRVNGKDTPLPYFPGMILTINMPRSPEQPILKYMIPAFIISIFITGASNIESLADMLAVESLSLLTYVSMYAGIRSEMPPTLSVSTIERIMLIYFVYSMVPIVDFIFG